MPKKTIAEPVFDQARQRWRVTIPAGMNDGRRVRSWHATRQAARAHIEKIQDKEAPAAIIAPALAMKADEARAILKPWELDLVQAAREVAGALKVLGGCGTILAAAKAFRASHNARTASKKFGEAVTLYLDSRADLRKATITSYTYTLQSVFEPLAEKVLADITTADIEGELEGKGPTARKMHRRNLGAFWRWACSPPREWASLATVAALEAVRGSSDADIQILNPAEVKALMRAAEGEGTAAAAAYAIATFGGVRMAELGKLKWGDVGPDHIEIGRAVAKKHARRLVPICPTLRAWIDGTRGDAAGDGLIVPANWTDVSKSVRRRAGWDVAARLLADPPKPTRGAWPANACRHTCASVQVAIGTPLETLTFAFGHSGGHDLLKKHYVGRMTRKDALAILSVAPKGQKIQLLDAV
jgi:integrase